MLTGEQSAPTARRQQAHPRLRLAAAAGALYCDPRLSPLMRELLLRSAGMLGGRAGSVSLVDAARDRYTKVAERGAPCRKGDSFSLDEGVTGRVFAGRRPVVLTTYRQVLQRHLPTDHPAVDGAVLAVPIWWRGDVIGANVLFAGGPRRYTSQDVQALEILTQLAAPGIAAAGARDQTVVTEVGPLRAVARPEPPAGRPDDRSPLSPRENEVLALVARGLTDRAAATLLRISPKTVEKHVGAVLRKTGTASRTAAVVHALDRGWLDRAG